MVFRQLAFQIHHVSMQLRPIGTDHPHPLAHADFPLSPCHKAQAGEFGEILSTPAICHQPRKTPIRWQPLSSARQRHTHLRTVCSLTQKSAATVTALSPAATRRAIRSRL